MEIRVKTSKRNELIDITAQIERLVKESKVNDGICIIYCPHTTAAITINENSDPDVVDDLLMGLNKIVNSDWPFKHNEGNSDAHLKSSILGCEKTVIIENNKLKLGRWQNCYFCEFDGPRNRKVFVKIISN